ncbi:MAG TPA: DUF72 domain-containing protein, partial [Lacunisphaera sp.]|nr:DUF72 domain-containing protein [Lacunisphaera sp.]
MSTEAFDLQALRMRVAALAEGGIYIGTSSWKYPGWLGQLYTRSRYEYRGRFAETRFERDCLREYAETFRTVCFDGAYYGFPEVQKLREMADQVPDDFRFAFKVTDEITLKRFPTLPRFGARGGLENGNFLNGPLFVDRVLGPLAAIRPKVGPVIFEFSKFHAGEYPGVTEFAADLDRFFGALPKGWHYSVELRNRKWLGPEYLACLQKHDVAPTFNSWTDMPPVSEQLGTVGEQRTGQLSVARFLLKPGRKYEEAVSKFQPYTKTQEINEEGRASIAAMIEQGWLKPTRDGTYLYINNRLEGNALMSVFAVLELL